ncbi:MAG: 4Fe-4S dicluster domain-containing protein [Planctomycetota bacterium]|nr:4Fe-4S dicluster domain-containing protein [Planctomycetota bacterium]
MTDTADTTVSRRDLLCTIAGCAAAASVAGCSEPTHTDFFRHHLHELTPEQLKAMLADLEQEFSAKYGKDVTVAMTEARPGVSFAYALDLSRCIGCRRCVHACVKENNQSREPAVQWIRVLEMDKEKGIDLHHANAYYEAETVPRPGHFYMPVACQHCRNAPCVKSCPVGATWQEPDGIVAIDYDWCIGCRCCMASCPYGARHFNWAEPELPAEELNPKTHYLGNRPRPKGVVEKCTWCIHRTREGLYPACVEVCPVGARKFGDLNDPASEIRYVLENKRVFVLKSELNTRPRFYYFYGV